MPHTSGSSAPVQEVGGALSRQVGGAQSRQVGGAQSRVGGAQSRVIGETGNTSLSVVVGDHNLTRRDPGEQRRTVRRVVFHPGYNGTSLDYDAALVELDAPLKFGDRVSPVCLPGARQEVPPPTSAPSPLGGAARQPDGAAGPCGCWVVSSASGTTPAG
ncbi:hypothetical protein ANANG_G00209190 [Anguilla anguilla]|uniref:Peptidase S1 domain-containing protein n=1 Tax=Anguilla anguilla TaxID=7936 RepID=A0A9D3M6Q8_ANGAN|nr:hypothetical protein ANANG_G00209190 [Anguilla anguilla]